MTGRAAGTPKEADEYLPVQIRIDTFIIAHLQFTNGRRAIINLTGVHTVNNEKVPPRAIKMNKLDKSTEDWLERVAKASDQHKGWRGTLGAVIALSVFAAVCYMFSGETVGNTYNPPNETLALICIAYIFTVFLAGIIYFLAVTRDRQKKKYANETMAEGTVYSSKVVSRRYNDENEFFATEIADVYKVLVAVRGLDKFLHAYVNVQVMSKRVYLQIPKWEKGDKVLVMYDFRKPRTCRIANIEKYISAVPENRQR